MRFIQIEGGYINIDHIVSIENANGHFNTDNVVDIEIILINLYEYHSRNN